MLDHAGIYQILNTQNGNRYIGSAQNISLRWMEHRSLLRRQKHHNRHLQAAWLSYGEDVFEFSCICICDKSNLTMFEQWFLDGIQPEYNILKFAYSALGHKHSEETRQKLSEMKKGKPQSPLNIQSRKTNAKPVSEETRRRLREAHLGHRMTEEAIDKRRVSNQKKRLEGTLKRKLTPDQVLEIRQLLDAGVSGKTIAKDFHIGEAMVSRIKLRLAWSWL